MFLFIAQYPQSVLELSPLQAGLWGLPSALAFLAGSMLTPAIVRRARPAYVIDGGMAFAAAGFGVLSAVGNGAAALALLVLGAVPPERAGAASAISETSSEFGGRSALRCSAAWSRRPIAVRWRAPCRRRATRSAAPWRWRRSFPGTWVRICSKARARRSYTPSS
jgi:hypothetical protein